MPANTYLFFDGNCREAMERYREVFGGELEVMTYGDAPEDVCAKDARDKIMHACLMFDEGTIMASDDLSDTPSGGGRPARLGPKPYRDMRGFAVAVFFPSADAVRRVYESLADGGSVMMPLQKTFWSEAFGGVIDRFGTPWMVAVQSQPQ